MNVVRICLLVHIGYILITAAWPLLSIDSFMQVTGYKTDIWLVKTVSWLLAVIGLYSLLGYLLRFNVFSLVLLLGMTAIAVAGVDLYYASQHIISRVYLIDGGIELLFVFLYSLLLFLFRGLRIIR